MPRTKKNKQTVREQDLPCEVPKCKNVMGPDGFVVFHKRVCGSCWAKDGKKGFSLRKIFNIKHDKTMGGDILLDDRCKFCMDPNKNGRHPEELPKGHKRTPIYKVVEQKVI